MLGPGSAEVEASGTGEGLVPRDETGNPLLQRCPRCEVEVAAAGRDVGPGRPHVGRLDRLHARLEAARASLDAALVRRSSVALELASSGLLDPATSLLLAGAAHEARSAPSGQELPQSDLTRALRAVFGQPGFRASVTSRDGAEELLTERDRAPADRYTALRAEVLRRIERWLPDSSLSVRSASRSLGVSPRILHAAVGAGGDTFAALVRRRRLERAAALLAEARNPATVTEIAASVGFDGPASFSRAFRREFGLPPHAYLIQARVRRARSLLRRGVPVVEAAALAGFADQAHLTSHFRRLVGVTPGLYRAGGRIVQDRPGAGPYPG